MKKVINKQLMQFAGASLIAGLLAVTSLAPAVADRSGMLVKHLSMGVGRSVIIDLPRDAAEVFIGSPKVANAIVRSSRKLYILASAPGQTTIIAMDAAGNQIAQIEVSSGRNIDELARILKTAMPTSNISLHTINDTIILTGSVDSASEAQQAMDIANGFVGVAASAGTATAPAGGAAILSGSVPADPGKVINSLTIRGRDQVMVKVTVAEVDRNVIKSLGLTAGGINGSWGQLLLDNPFSLNLQQISGSGINIGRGANGQAVNQIKAFERNSVGRVLAEPTLTAISGESAKFTAGGELPIPSGSNCTAPSFGVASVCTITIVYKPYGVTLNFTPVVLAPGRIQLHVATEVTEIDEGHQIQTVIASVPAFLTRKNETTVELPSGGSIATAGLITTRSRQVINGLPGLMNLPILGSLFRSRDYLREETELMIVVTPYIVKPVPAKALALPTDNFADATDPQSVLLGRVNRIYSTTSNPQILSTFHGKVGFIND